MPDLAPGAPPSGPTNPTADASPALPIPGPLVPTDEMDLKSLSPEELQMQLKARERDLKFRLHALRHEVGALGDDVTLGGRPLLDRIRQRKELALALAAGAGALAGVLLGLRARARRRPGPDDELDFVRARLATLLDEAAHDVATRGRSPEDALRRTLKSTPVIYTERDPVTQARSSAAQTMDVVVKSMAGFAAKAATDALTKKLTGREETFAAVADAD